MTIQITPMGADELAGLTPDKRAGLGALTTERGNLPLDQIDVTARITGLSVQTTLSQGFANPYDVPLEATYVFPLPDRAAVTGMRMEADGRVVEGVLKERQQAREEYDRAIEAGQRASIAEEERPDVFTMRVGNIMPGERVTVRLTLAGVVPYEDGTATYRFPLVVAPRYIPGTPIDGSVGGGVEPDTDAVPDASRITPPVLLPGFPNPVRLGIRVRLDPAGLPLRDLRSSLHQVDVAETDGAAEITIGAGERADRDFVLRWAPGGEEPDGEVAAVTESLAVVPDEEGDEGTFQLTLVPPVLPEQARARDVVLVLDRSGSMGGWKMVAARRAAARIIDTLGGGDRFAVLAFDNVVDRPDELPGGLVEATDRHRFRAVEFFAGLQARGGTEMLRPLRDGLDLMSHETTRDRVLVLVTDGQIGNEDQILHELGTSLAATRVHTVGIDQAVNAGFLGRLAALGGGRCELVESEDRLDEAMDRIHRRIATPLVTGITLEAPWVAADSVSPARLPDLFAGAPVRIMGRYRGGGGGEVAVTGWRPDGSAWRTTAKAVTGDNPAVAAVWARGRLRDLEDRYVTSAGDQERQRLERTIVDTSLRFGVLCRFTAYVAVDDRAVNSGGELHRVTQPVELPAGWQLMAAAAPAGSRRMRTAMTGFAPAAIGVPQRAGMARRDSLDRAADPRELLATELRRLTELADAPPLRRWYALADLGSRLRALIDQLDLPELVKLAEALADCDGRYDGDVLARLWSRTLDVLNRASGGATDPGDRTTGPQRSRTAFWKR